MPAGHVLNPNKAATRLRGPVLYGAPAILGEGAVNGESSEPLTSFWNAPEFGYYVNSSAQVTFTGPGPQQLIVYTSQLVRSGSTAGATNPASFAWASTAFLSTAAVSGYIYVPQTTYAMSSSGGTSSGPTPTAINTGAALVFDSARGKLSIFSTVGNQWLSVTLSSS